MVSPDSAPPSLVFHLTSDVLAEVDAKVRVSPLCSTEKAISGMGSRLISPKCTHEVISTKGKAIRPDNLIVFILVYIFSRNPRNPADP